MEYDSIHSKMVMDIFPLRDYAIILQTARIRPSPYRVKMLKHDDFLKINGSYFNSIRPGKKVQEPNEPITWIRIE